MRKIALMLVLLLILGTTPAWALCGAVGDWIDNQANSGSYPAKAGGMILKGTHDLVDASMELLYHPYDEIVNKGDYVFGLLKGIGHGIAGFTEGVIYGATNMVFALCPETAPVDSSHQHF